MASIIYINKKMMTKSSILMAGLEVTYNNIRVYIEVGYISLLICGELNYN